MGVINMRTGLIAAILVFGLIGVMAAAQPAPAIQIQQGDFQTTIYPIMTPSSAVEFYNYSALDYNALMNEELPRHTLLFVHRNSQTNALSLIIVHNAPDAGSAGRAGFQIDGLPSSARLALRDDPTRDTYDLANGRFQWEWASGHTDGLVIEGLRAPLTLTVRPQFEHGIVGWKLLTQKSDDGPAERVPMPSLSDPMTLAIGEGLPTPDGDPTDTDEPTEPTEPSGPTLSADFAVSPQPGYVGSPVRFNARGSTGNIQAYAWDVDGDGSFDARTSRPTFEHTYQAAGDYEATLRLTDDDGNTASFTRTIEIREADTRAERTISTPEAQPGTIFRVEVDVTVGVPSNGLGVEETLPEGWVVEPVQSDGGIFKFTGNTAQWVFPKQLKINENRRIIYDVRVPSAETIDEPLPQVFSISGTVQSSSPSFSAPVTGERDVRIVSCLSPATAFAHLELGEGQVDLRGSETISTEQMRRALSDWQQGAGVLGTCDNTMSHDQLLTVVRHHLLSIPVDEALPAIPEDDGQVTITRTIETDLTGDRLYLPEEAGRQFRVELDIRANQDVTGLTVAETLPKHWLVTPRGATGTFKADATAWTVAERIPEGGTRQIVYDVTVPEDAETGAVELVGEGDLGPVPFLLDVGGESDVEVLDCLSIPLAAAHLNVDTGEVDIELDNTVTRAQVDAAFALWLEDESLPGTCGQPLNLAILQDLIDLMLAGEPAGQTEATTSEDSDPGDEDNP